MNQQPTTPLPQQLQRHPSVILDNQGATGGSVESPIPVSVPEDVTEIPQVQDATSPEESTSLRRSTRSNIGKAPSRPIEET